MGTSNVKKADIKLEKETAEVLKHLAQDKKYLSVVDFDEHFNDVTLDWTNEKIR